MWCWFFFCGGAEVLAGTGDKVCEVLSAVCWRFVLNVLGGHQSLVW